MANQSSSKDEEVNANRQLALYLVPVAVAAALIAWYRNSERFILVRLFYVVLAYVLNIFYIGYIMYKAVKG